MQPEQIHQTNPQNDIQTPLFIISPQLRLGYVTFNRNKNPLNKRIQQALKYLERFYTREFIRRKVQTLYVDKKPNHQSPQKIEQIKKNPQKYFSLESIFDYHVHFISQTDQPTFILEDADFKVITKSPIKNLRQEHLWSVSFTQLKVMNLSNCQLLNIQGLSYCELPMLQRLQLQINHITSISVLSKCTFKSLKKISLFNNPLPVMSRIIRLDCPKLQRMNIDEDKQRINHWPFLNNDPSWRSQMIDFIPKLQNLKGMNYIPISYQKRLQPKWHQPTMKKINPKMEFHTLHEKRKRKRKRSTRNENFFDFIEFWPEQNPVDGPPQEQHLNRTDLIQLRRLAMNHRRRNNNYPRMLQIRERHLNREQ